MWNWAEPLPNVTLEFPLRQGKGRQINTETTAGGGEERRSRKGWRRCWDQTDNPLQPGGKSLWDFLVFDGLPSCVTRSPKYPWEEGMSAPPDPVSLGSQLSGPKTCSGSTSQPSGPCENTAHQGWHNAFQGNTHRVFALNGRDGVIKTSKCCNLTAF